MWAVFIIDGDPLCSEFPHFLKTSKQGEIEAFFAIRPIEAFNEGILRETSRLNVIARHPIALPPILKSLSNEFWPLSTRIMCGNARSGYKRSRIRITRAAGSDVSISIARASRLKSSITLKVRNREL